MKICGRDYKLEFNCSKVGGAEFYKNKDGDGLVRFGKFNDLGFIAEMLVHEAVEAILVEDFKRFACTEKVDEDYRYQFHFDHDYLCTLGPKILDALLSSGFFKLVDGRPKKKRPRSATVEMRVLK